MSERNETMIFDETKAIYEQIADRLCNEIIAGKYKENYRIPSVREYAITLQVNTNTAVKAYELLSIEEVIYNKRGLGYFVSTGARKQIMKVRKREFMSKMLPNLFHEMQLLGITEEEVKAQWQQFLVNNEKNKNKL